MIVSSVKVLTNVTIFVLLKFLFVIYLYVKSTCLYAVFMEHVR